MPEATDSENATNPGLERLAAIEDPLAFTAGFKAELQGRPHGEFYRYLGTEDLRRLATTGELVFNGKTAYERAVSEEYNSSRYSDTKMLGQCLTEAFRLWIDDGPEDDIDLSAHTDEEVQHDLEQLESYMFQKDPKYAGLVAAFDRMTAERDTMPMIDYLKRVGGDKLMMALQRHGWDYATPLAAFSDLVSVSVGMPMYLSGSDRVVVVELDFSSEELAIPETDHLNEHEVMVRRITPANLRRIYTQEDNETFWEYLEAKYPDYFDHYPHNPLTLFAQRKPLHELLAEMGITGASHSTGETANVDDNRQ